MNTEKNTAFKSKDDIRKAIAELDAAISKLNEKFSDAPAVAVKKDIISASTKGKLIVTALLICFSVFAMLLSSYAYFTASTDSSENRIVAGTVGVDVVNLGSSAPGGSAGTELDPIKILPGYVEMREIYAKNTGDIALYVRARTETAITLSEGNSGRQSEVDNSLVIFDIDDTYWKYRDGYYYYALPLLAGEVTSELFSQILFSKDMGNLYKDSTIRVKIVFEMVQFNNNGSNVFDAAGWASASEGGAS